MLAALIGFCAFNSVDQLISSASYQQLSYDSVLYDEGNRFANSSWMPVRVGEEPKIVKLSGQVYIIGGAGFPPDVFNPLFVVKIFKTNYSTTTYPFTGIGHADYSMPGVVSIQFNGQDLAMPGDVYSVYLYASASPDGNVKFPSTIKGTVQVDDSRYHNFWCGSI